MRNGIQELQKIYFIGKSGDGKSTFINALINVLLNVNIKYDARYKIVLEESKNGQNKSQTPEIKIYNVKIKNKPILRLIDTPGFIDTEGKDEIYIEQFRKFFKSEISYLHCICFILNSSSYRYNKIQIELFNKVSSLFAEEIKNNFVFILTHYSFIGNDDSSVALLENDVFQNIINANNIFKLDSECAFTGDINIRNIIWEKSTKVIENLINEKFFKLNPVNTAQSAEVIEKRNELNQLFNKKIIEFKDKLKEIRNLLNDNSSYHKKINISITSETINTNCRKCNKTCQEKCDCNPLMNIRYFCNIFNFWGLCKECGCYFIRHKRENFEFKDKEEIMKFNNDGEKEKFLQEEVDLIEKNNELDFLDINNEIDKNILNENSIDLSKSFAKYYKGIEEGAYDKLVKLKKIEAIKIVLKIHNFIEELNKLALNKNIDNNIEKFFDEIKKLEDFKNEEDIIEKIKNGFLKINGGKYKNNRKFLILTDCDLNYFNEEEKSYFTSLKIKHFLDI